MLSGSPRQLIVVLRKVLLNKMKSLKILEKQVVKIKVVEKVK